jgi:hypothetical protein
MIVGVKNKRELKSKLPPRVWSREHGGVCSDFHNIMINFMQNSLFNR